VGAGEHAIQRFNKRAAFAFTKSLKQTGQELALESRQLRSESERLRSASQGLIQKVRNNVADTRTRRDFARNAAAAQ
jgi:hypothetical protein